MRVLKMCAARVKEGEGERRGYGLASVRRGWPYMAGLPWAARLTCDGEDGYFRHWEFNLLISSR